MGAIETHAGEAIRDTARGKEDGPSGHTESVDKTKWRVCVCVCTTNISSPNTNQKKT